jgi:CubicO group peptidase (beta-lactamase class C family)
MRRFLPILATLAALAAPPAAPLAAQSATSPASRAALLATIDSMVADEMAERKWPGATLLLVRGRDTIVARAYGQADLELGVPARADGVYWAGSVTKQFVAALVLKLAQRGVLTLDDTVGRWLPETPASWRGVTLRQLLWHTSGIRSYTGAPGAGAALVRPGVTSDSMLALVRALPFDFTVGTQMYYNNSGYLLLGQIVERATARPLADALRDVLLAPLGMTRSAYCDLRALVPGRVSGYGRTREGRVERAVLWWPDAAHGAGALCSTVGDLVTWSQALHGGRVLDPASYRTMTTPGRLADGTPLRYAMGMSLVEVAGRRAYQHTGGIAGFTAWLAHLPDDSLHVAMLVNLIAGSERPSGVGERIVARVLGRIEPPAPARAIGASDAAAYVGTYGTSPVQVRVEQREGGLALVQGQVAQPLAWQGGRAFRLGTDIAVFERADGRAPAHRLRLDRGSSYLLLDRQPEPAARPAGER